ncbi:hypothetical protein NECAME_02925 [Necator americanus]|uniref:Endonuclease/exonuclease/phosphatase domain-containing protein n=1 Tax=Necator americanus TaxID=51031 RepID=W2T879_NECAM|nr:hypothetical protein NECAME_02925 [Necator americanus]ETN78220.1 hypothetical protein NECAME_02925 [Necator americanus]
MVRPNQKTPFRSIEEADIQYHSLKKRIEPKKDDKAQRLIRLKEILKQRNGEAEIEEFRRRYLERREKGVVVPPLQFICDDVIGLTETRRRHPLNAVFDTAEELFLGTCDSRGVGGVGVLVKTSIAENIDSFEQLATRIGRLRMRRCGPTPALTIFVAYAPTSSYEGDVEAFYMDLEKSYREDHTFYKVIVGDFNANTGPRRTKRKGCIGTHGLQWNEQGENLSEFIMTTKTIHGNSQFQNLLSTQDVGVTRRRVP